MLHTFPSHVIAALIYPTKPLKIDIKYIFVVLKKGAAKCRTPFVHKEYGNFQELVKIKIQIKYIFNLNFG